MYINREKIVNEINKAINLSPITILIGARQVGKTTILKNLKHLTPSIYLIGQDPEVAAIFQKLSIAESYLKTNLNSELKGFLLIDEFQYIDNISTMLKLLTDSNSQLRVICSGSSSLDIIQKVEESLAGRVRVIDTYSLSFSEYLKFHSEKLFELYSKYDQQSKEELIYPEIKLLFEEYLIYGGMPKQALSPKHEDKIQLLDDIYKTYLLRDVRSYIRNEDVVSFNKLLILLASQIGSLVNVNELANSSGLSYRKCEDYIYLLEQMFIIKMVEPFFTNKRKVITKMKKVYFTELGLRNIIIGNFNSIENRNDNGALFENFVYLELLRILPSYTRIYFYRTKDGAEVDFIIDNMKQKFAIETKFKNLNKEFSLKSFKSITEIENIAGTYLINRNFNLSNGVKFLQGYLTEKIVFS